LRGSRRRDLIEARPNAAHVALARLEAELAKRGDHLVLVTQNVDDLHERAGSQRVLHMHGELTKVRCTHCDGVQEWRTDLGRTERCRSCSLPGRLRPHVVWFGEMPLGLDLIDAALTSSDLFVAIGTSEAVYPAAGFVGEARAAGIRTCELYLEPSDNARVFDERRYGRASEVVPAWVADVLGAACRGCSRVVENEEATAQKTGESGGEAYGRLRIGTSAALPN
jgi:NAD-dependent deacetylase